MEIVRLDCILALKRRPANVRALKRSAAYFRTRAAVQPALYDTSNETQRSGHDVDCASDLAGRSV